MFLFIALWWLPNVLRAVGLAVCIAHAFRTRSLGLVLFAVWFACQLCMSIAGAVWRHFYAAVPAQGSASVALVVHLDVSAPFTLALLVAAVILVSRRLATGGIPQRHPARTAPFDGSR